MNNMINHGVLLGRQPTDYTADERVGGLPYEERNPSGDWRPFLPIGERQYSNPGGGDSMSCVSFSAINSIEIQEKFLTGQESNYSDRWTAKMSGTTVDGNYLWKVADTIRHQGLVLEASYPAPQAPWTFNKFHQEISEPLYSQLLAEGQIWLQEWSPAYEWIEVTKPSFLKHLKHAPLQIVVPGHAIVGLLCEQDVVDYFDTYEHGSATNFQGQKPFNQITDVLKIVLTKKGNQMFLANDKGTVYLVTGNQDRRKIGIADLKSLGLFGDEPQVPMDTSSIPEYNVIVDAIKITHK